MDLLKIELSQEQLQRTINIIGQAPYIEVADIIDTIKEQVRLQTESHD